MTKKSDAEDDRLLWLICLTGFVLSLPLLVFWVVDENVAGAAIFGMFTGFFGGQFLFLNSPMYKDRSGGNPKT